MIKGKIAFFDSGIGGLTVLSACMKVLDDYGYYYYGDNARAPYGNLPVETIRRYVFEAFEEFAKLEVDAAVVACNTATAVCLEDLRQKFPFPIIGTEPALYPAATVEGEVLVLATRATVESRRIQRLLEKACRANPKVRFRLAPCDALAGGVEKGLPFGTLKSLLPVCSPDAVVLGCTHYIYIKKEIADFYKATVFDGNDGVAHRLKQVLEEERLTTFSKNFVSDRDEQPLLSKSISKRTIFLPFCGEKKLRYEKAAKTNKCLQKRGNIDEKEVKTGHFDQICFLGSGKEINYKKYEQMFVVNQK